MKHDHEFEVPEEPIKHTVGPSEEVTGAVARVKQHVKKHQVVYAVGTTAIVCFAVGTRFKRPINIDFNPVIDFKPVMNNVVNNHVETNIGRMSKIVRDAATGEEWQKIKYLAEKIAKEEGISVDSARNLLNRHFRGELATVFAKTYEIAGLRTDF